MRTTHLMLTSVALSCILSPTAVSAADWPQFRGPTGQGHSAERGLPLEWSEAKNIAWKTPIAGLGWSSPVIRGDQIWLTTATDEGHSLRAVCVSRSDGKVVHDVEVFRKDDPGKIHAKNSHASPTPILEDDRVYVHFGAHGTACLDTSGKVRWKTELKYYQRHGPGGSPALFDDLMIISCDGFDSQYVVALDKHTGEIRWKKERAGKHAYSTPLVIDVAGTPQAISTGGDRVVAYNPRTGDEIWSSRYVGYSCVPRPVYGHGLVFICSGFDEPWLWAIRPDGGGDVTDSHVGWKLSHGAPLNPSPLLVGDELYIVSDNGIGSCLDAKTGERHWRERIGGNFSASPLFADGRIYFLNETGQATTIAPGREFHKLAVSQLPGRTLASMAVSDGAIFLRTDTHLYRIQEQR